MQYFCQLYDDAQGIFYVFCDFMFMLMAKHKIGAVFVVVVMFL